MSGAIDWKAIERAYRAGRLSVHEIARQQGVTEGAIRKRAKRDSWPVRQTVRTAVRSASPPTVVTGPWAGAGEPAESILDQPDWLMRFADGEWGRKRAEIAAARWEQLVEIMTSRGTLDRDNGPLIEMAAGAYADWKLAEANVAEFGPIVPSPVTKVPMHSPYKAIADAAVKRLVTAEDRLGIPPVLRSKAAKVPPKVKRVSAADEFVGAGKK